MVPRDTSHLPALPRNSGGSPQETPGKARIAGESPGPITFSLWGAMLTLVLRRGHVNSRENMATAEYRRGHGTRHCEKVIGPGGIAR